MNIEQSLNLHENAPTTKKPPIKRESLIFSRKVWGVIIFVGSIVFLTPKENNIVGTGFMDPIDTYNISVQSDGTAIVRECKVEAGDFVRTDDILCRLEDPAIGEKIKKLESELQQIEGEIQTNFVTVNTSKGTLRSAEIAKMSIAKEVKKSELEAKRAELAYQLAMNKGLQPKSKIDGFIVEPKSLSGFVDQPYDKSKPLMRIAAIGGTWNIRVLVDEAGVYEINEYIKQQKKLHQSGSKTDRLMTYPEVKIVLNRHNSTPIYGIVTDVGKIVQNDQNNPQGGKKVEVKISFDTSQIGLNPEDFNDKNFVPEDFIGTHMGAGLTAYIKCGSMTRLGYMTKGLRSSFWSNIHNIK